FSSPPCIWVNHFHLKTARATRHCPSNPPESHDAQRLPPHVCPHQLIQVPMFPFSRTRQRFRLAQPPRHCHHQCPREIRRRFVQNAGSVCRRYAPLRACCYVDVVESHRHVRRDAEFRRRLQQFLVYFLGQQAHQPLFVFHAPQNFFPRRAFRLGPVFHLAAFVQDFPRGIEQAVLRKHFLF